MSSPLPWIIIGWILLISAAIYLASLFFIVAALKKGYPDYWQRIGSPNLLDPNSITIVFPKIIFGRDLPDEAITKYQLQLWSLRLSLLICMVIFIFLMVMAYLGKAPK